MEVWDLEKQENFLVFIPRLIRRFHLMIMGLFQNSF